MTYKLSCYPYKISLHGSGDILNAADCYRRLAGAQTMSLLVWFALVTPHVREVSTGITTIIPVSISHILWSKPETEETAFARTIRLVDYILYL